MTKEQAIRREALRETMMISCTEAGRESMRNFRGKRIHAAAPSDTIEEVLKRIERRGDGRSPVNLSLMLDGRLIVLLLEPVYNDPPVTQEELDEIEEAARIRDEAEITQKAIEGAVEAVKRHGEALEELADK